MTTQAVGDRRLLRLADILDVADAKHRAQGEPTYVQGKFRFGCGTPACALGHHAVATPKRWTFGDFSFPLLRNPPPELPSPGHALSCAQVEFSLTETQAADIFGYSGCDRASTAKKAARFIRRFVKARAPK